MKNIFVIILYLTLLLGCKNKFDIKDLERLAEEDIINNIQKNSVDYRDTGH